jgi:recombination protein RecT
MAASLDLPINTNLQFAHLVPYRRSANGPKVCQFQMGWRGFVQLAIRTGQYKTMHVTEVYKDELKSWNALTGEIEFTPQNEWKLREKGKPADIIGYVAFLKLMNGFEKYFYMTRQQCEAHGRRYSKSYSTGQWTKDFDAMAKKTVIKLLLSKFGIMSIDMQKAIESDQAVIHEDGSLDYVDAQNVPPQSAETTADRKPLEIPEDTLVELNSLYDILGVNQAQRFMEISACRTMEELKALHDRLVAKVTSKKPASGKQEGDHEQN